MYSHVDVDSPGHSTRTGRSGLRASLSMDTSVSSTSLSSHVDVDSLGHSTRTGRSGLRVSLSMDTSVSSTSLSSHVDVDSPGNSTRTGRLGLGLAFPWIPQSPARHCPVMWTWTVQDTPQELVGQG